MELREKNNGTPAISIIDTRIFSNTISSESREVRSPRKIRQDSIKSNGQVHGVATDHPTSYLETLTHLLKANVGVVIFSMGDAFKNGGLILSILLTVFIGIIAVHSQHILIKCSERMKEKLGIENYLDFAKTVELCIENGPLCFRSWSTTAKWLVNFFICATQLGFCSMYFIFISSSFKQICDTYNLVLDVHLLMLLILFPILILSWITNLKYLAPFSGIANICMAVGIGGVFYYACQDLPSPNDRQYFGNVLNLPLFFGTVICAFEGIALVLPLKNSMKKPEYFNGTFGVLNIGMTFVAILITSFGSIGYWKWGENVAGSLTFNLPPTDQVAQVVKLTVSLGMLLTYPLQFFVPIQITWPYVKQKFGPFKRDVLMQELFRTSIVFITFAIAELVPKLNLFISLVGALCSTLLALLFPPVIQLISAWNASGGPGAFLLIKNSIILIVALFSFVAGTYESTAELVKSFQTEGF